jgi:hypothetical protein
MMEYDDDDLLESALYFFHHNMHWYRVTCPSIEFTHYIRIHMSDYEPLNQKHDYAEHSYTLVNILAVLDTI